MDFSKLQQEIEALRQKQAVDEARVMAEAQARIEKARRESEEKRLAAEKAQEEASQAFIERRKQAEEARKAEERAEQARLRAEEHKQNLAQEKRLHEELVAVEMKKALDDLQFRNEQAIQELRNKYAMALVAEKEEGKAVDGTDLKPVRANEDGTANPLDRFRQSVNN